jgi:hypothetical protein
LTMRTMMQRMQLRVEMTPLKKHLQRNKTGSILWRYWLD